MSMKNRSTRPWDSVTWYHRSQCHRQSRSVRRWLSCAGWPVAGCSGQGPRGGALKQGIRAVLALVNGHKTLSEDVLVTQQHRQRVACCPLLSVPATRDAD